MKSALFFVCGRGRSGTWLLQSILNSHSKISMSPESLFIMDLYPKYGNSINWGERTKIQFIKDLCKDDKILDWWKLDEEMLTNEIKGTDVSNFQEAIQFIFKTFGQKNGKSGKFFLYGDKNPENLIYLDTIKASFPESKTIIMIRDPRANVASFKKTGFDANSSTVLSYRWKRYNAKINKYHRKYPGQIYILKFEDLITNFEKEVKDICSFLGLEFDKNMLNFHERPTQVFEWNIAIKTPPDPSRLENWKKELSEKEIRKIEHICASLMEEYGYVKMSTSKIGIPSKFGMFFSNLYARSLSLTEQHFFKIPFSIRHFILAKYRRKTTVIQK